MKINILGSGTCVPSLKRHSCSILIRDENIHMLIDAGPSTMEQLLKLGVKINDINIILLSHFHLDHCAEIPPFLFATKYSGLIRNKKLKLIGGKGIKKMYDTLNKAYDDALVFPENEFEIVELNEKGKLDLKNEDICLYYSKANHRPESLSYKIVDKTGYCLIYSGDTDYCDNLIELSKNADLLICESAFPDDKKTKGHLTPSYAGKIASKANVKKLVLTHLYPECDNIDIKAQAKKHFNKTIIVAKDLMLL